MKAHHHIKSEKNLEKIAVFLNLSKELLKRQDPDLLMKMIEAAGDDKMIEVNHFGMELKDRF
jgi:hypothetical protein